MTTALIVIAIATNTHNLLDLGEDKKLEAKKATTIPTHNPIR